MSADNFLVTVLDEQKRIELYDVSMSDENISSDPALIEKVRSYVRENYKNRRVGVFETMKEVRGAMAEYEEKRVVEYGPLMLHYE